MKSPQVNTRNPTSEATLADELERYLAHWCSVQITGRKLHQALGFENHAALRQAEVRNLVGVPLFRIEGRGKGKYARSRDVAEFLARCIMTPRVKKVMPEKIQRLHELRRRRTDEA